AAAARASRVQLAQLERRLEHGKLHRAAGRQHSADLPERLCDRPSVGAILVVVASVVEACLNLGEQFRLELCGYRRIELLALQCRLQGFLPVSQDLFLGKHLALLALSHRDTSLRTTDREWEIRARESSPSLQGLQRFELAAQRSG